VADAVPVTQPWRHGFDVAALHQVLAAGGLRLAGLQGELLATLGPTQDAHQAPHRVVMHRRALAGAPDEADHRKALQRVAVQQVLRIAVGPQRGKGRR
jgi:hypothetical protein